MPQRRLPRTLECLARDVVSISFLNLVCSSQRNEEQLQELQDVFGEFLTGPCKQKLLESLLDFSEELDGWIKYSVFRILVDNKTRILNCGHFPLHYHEKVLTAIKKDGAILSILNLKGVWVQDCDKIYLYESLKNLPNLTVLSVPYFCDNEVFRIVGRKCHKLKTIDASGSPLITRDGLLDLCTLNGSGGGLRSTECSSTLQQIDIGGPGSGSMSAVDIVILLHRIPKLISLGTYEYTGDSVKRYYDDHKEDPPQLLLQYLHDVQTTCERLSAINHSCKNLHKLYFDTPDPLVVQYLHLLRNLSSLKLTKTKYKDLKEFLQKRGEKITELTFIQTRDAIEMTEITDVCPQLEHLEIHNSHAQFGSDSPVLYKNLKTLKIYHTFYTTHVLKNMMMSSPALTWLSIGDCGFLSDDSMVSILSTGGLSHLENLWFGHAPELTIISVQCIMSYCNNIKTVGNISTWSVTIDEYQFLLTKIQDSNLDLALWAY